MALKEKNVQKPNKLLEILKTEQRWENYVLLVLSIIALTLSSLILADKLQPAESFPIIGQYPDLFAWILIILSITGILLVIYPFLLMAVPEIRKVTWATKSQFLENFVRTMIFVLFLTAFFFVGSLIFERFIEVIL